MRKRAIRHSTADRYAGTSRQTPGRPVGTMPPGNWRNPLSKFRPTRARSWRAAPPGQTPDLSRALNRVCRAWRAFCVTRVSRVVMDRIRSASGHVARLVLPDRHPFPPCALPQIIALTGGSNFRPPPPSSSLLTLVRGCATPFGADGRISLVTALSQCEARYGLRLRGVATHSP